MTYAIEARDLTKQFGKYKAVDNLNLKIPAGSICGFLGRNGAGKTTTIKMLVGLARPTNGSIYLMETERKFGHCNNKHIGYLPDVPNFYGYMKASEYLDFCGKLHGMDRVELKNRTNELLELVNLTNTKTTISGFSRGMKQRLGIAQALINKPSIIILDEPISALDPIGRHEVMQIIRSLRGIVTVFFSTHVLSDVENVCDYGLILEKGKLLAEDSIENLKKKHASNVAVMKLYSSTDGSKFYSFMKELSDVNIASIEEKSPVEFILRADDMQLLGKRIPFILSELGIPLESYTAYVPSLEDIFLEVTANA